ncbi:hypothetical protein DSO57_1032691 [Entomophthora muscae]|uniref:Uncharacterized protein n=1 Tax=Entomophthora muscae TaxID=34485 RepID=A0ACC2T0B3_9FUNG|nr:hypothetical protein DSO57_1032691 [Entomophthora muscae]
MGRSRSKRAKGDLVRYQLREKIYYQQTFQNPLGGIQPPSGLDAVRHMETQAEMVSMGFSQQEIEILNSVPIQAPCTPSRRGCLRQGHNCGGKNTNREIISGLIFARTRETRPLA